MEGPGVVRVVTQQVGDGREAVGGGVVERGLAVSGEDAHRADVTAQQPEDRGGDLELLRVGRVDAPPTVGEHDAGIAGDPEAAGLAGMRVGVHDREPDARVELAVAGEQEAGVVGRAAVGGEEGADAEGRVYRAHQRPRLGRQREPVGGREVGLGVVAVGGDVGGDDDSDGDDHCRDAAQPPRSHRRSSRTTRLLTTPSARSDTK